MERPVHPPHLGRVEHDCVLTPWQEEACRVEQVTYPDPPPPGEEAQPVAHDPAAQRHPGRPHAWISGDIATKDAVAILVTEHDRLQERDATRRMLSWLGRASVCRVGCHLGVRPTSSSIARPRVETVDGRGVAR